MKLSRIMYIEKKEETSNGYARIGLVKFSQTGRSYHYSGKTFLKVKGGYKYNCIELKTGDYYWISGCKKDGTDRLYSQGIPVFIDKDIRADYWKTIRDKPHLQHKETSH